MARALLAAAATLAVLAAAPAHAATVQVERDIQGFENPDLEYHHEPVYTAAPGEKNDVLVTSIDSHTLRITDPGATISTGRGCTLIAPHTAECRNPDMRALMAHARVLAGDGDDTVRVAGATVSEAAGVRADGGPGNDVLIGGLLGDELDGGGGGHDVLDGGDLEWNALTDGDTSGVDVDSDEISGGGVVSYASRSAPVTADISRSVFGELGEGDVVRDVYGARGGSGDDTLIGDEQRNFLAGGTGDDRVVARANEDSIFGGAGDDRLYGQDGDDSIDGDGDDYLRTTSNSGNDVISAGAGDDDVTPGTGADAITCGSGRDSTRHPQVFDYLKPGCETVSFARAPTTSLRAEAYPLVVGPSSVTFSVGCPMLEERDGACSEADGVVALRDTRRRRIGAATFTTAARPEGTVTTNVKVRLNRLGRRLLARPRGARVIVGVSGPEFPNARWTVLLRTQR